jgi:DNA-binding transcriptional LysR family regulator
MDLELWHLRYVVAVADELNFTRAAEQLHISQPALSTRIRELETRLGFPLFARTSRRVALTPAGIVLAERARVLLADAELAVAAARNAAAAKPVLQVGVMGSSGAVLFGLVSKRVAQVRPDAQLEPQQLIGPELIESGDIEVAFTRFEADETELVLAPLLRERRVVAMSEDHPRARETELGLADLEGETFLTQQAAANPRFRERWLAEQRRAGFQAQSVREIANAEELFALLAARRGICLVPATLARYYARPGLAYVSVRDADTVPISLAWRPGAEQPLLTVVIEAAQAVAAQLLAEPGQQDWIPG